MMTTTVGAINAFMPLFAEERTLGNAGLYYTVWGTALLGARFLAGAVGDRYGRTVVVIPSLAAQALSLLLLANSETQLVMLISAAIGGMALGGVQVSVMSLIVDRTAPARRGAAMATYTIAWDVGAVVGGGLLGFVVDATSYSSGFTLVALLPLLGMVIYVTRVARVDRDTPAAY
jgi:MFS family permease